MVFLSDMMSYCRRTWSLQVPAGTANGRPFMENLLPLLIQAIAGAVGGNVAGRASPNLDQGTLINSIAGLVGGGLGGQIIAAVLPGLMAGGGLSLQGILTSLVSGGAGGGVLLAVLGVVKNMMGNR